MCSGSKRGNISPSGISQSSQLQLFALSKECGRVQLSPVPGRNADTGCPATVGVQWQATQSLGRNELSLRGGFDQQVRVHWSGTSQALPLH